MLEHLILLNQWSNAEYLPLILHIQSIMCEVTVVCSHKAGILEPNHTLPVGRSDTYAHPYSDSSTLKVLFCHFDHFKVTYKLTFRLGPLCVFKSQDFHYDFTWVWLVNSRGEKYPESVVHESFAKPSLGCLQQLRVGLAENSRTNDFWLGLFGT